MEGDNCEHGLAIDPAVDVEEERLDSSRTMRRIVVAVDGSDGSDMAVHYALQRIADPITDHLFLLHVKTPRHLPSDSLAAASPTCLPSSPRASSFSRRGNTKDHTATATAAAAAALPFNGRFSRKRQHDSVPFSAWPSAFSAPSESYHAARASSASLGASTDRAAALLASCFLDPAAAAAPAAPATPTPWQLPRSPIGRLSESGAGGGNGAEPLRHVRRRSVDGLRMSGSSVSAAPESAEMRKAAVAAALMLESAFESSGGAAAACLDAAVAGGDDQKAKAASLALWSRADGDLEGSGSANRPDTSLPAVHCFPGGFGAVKSGEKRAGVTNAGTGSDDWASRFRGADSYGAAGGAWCGGSGGSGGSVRAHGRRLGRPLRQQQQQHMDVKVARWLERFAREAEQMGVACDTAVVEAMDPCEVVLCRVHAVRAHLLILSGHLADSAGGAAAFASDPHTTHAPPVAAAVASSGVSLAGSGAGAGGVGGLSGVRARGGMERIGVRGGLGVGVRGGGGVESGCPVLVVRPGGRGRIRDHRSSLMEF
ncbi:unnamed protein product [Closterium sp. Naga37s-1]|nr:unnamed protein product [Closterium sp. Naga37s-1]